MIGYDLLIFAAVLGVGGSLLLAKSNLQPSFAKHLAQTFLGSNPYQVRNLTTQRVEAVAGAAWLCLSLPIIVVGTILTTGGNQQVRTFDYFSHAFGLAGVGVFGLWGTLRITERISRKIYLPQMVQLHREIFDKSNQYLLYGGVLAHEMPHQENIPEATRRERLATVTEWLDQIGTLIDVQRNPSEDDGVYIARLKPFFED